MIFSIKIRDMRHQVRGMPLLESSGDRSLAESSQLTSLSRSSKVAWYVEPGTLEIPQWGGLESTSPRVLGGLWTRSFDDIF